MTITKSKRQLAKVYSLVLCTFLLTACGFKLRGDYLLPEQLQTIYLSSDDKQGELSRVVKQHLLFNQVKLLALPNNKNAQLRILKDKLDRRTLSVFDNGQVAEYELIYTVNVQLILPEQEPHTISFEINRDYQDDPNFALAKSRELALILSEMRQEAADIILRKMASNQPLP